MYQQLTEETEALAKELVDIAYKVHKTLGPGLLESVYERCFCYELSLRGIAHERQKEVPVTYEGMLMDNSLKLDVLVADRIIVEFKAQENPHPVWNAQLLSYLKLMNKHLGFVINFHVLLMKDGIKRIVR
jgi:GxxExxY protein